MYIISVKISNILRFLLTLAPLVENAAPESTNYESFIEEAMEVSYSIATKTTA